MKAGRSIESLAREIMRQHETKKDFIVPTPKMAMGYEDNRLQLQITASNSSIDIATNDVSVENFGIRDTAHANISKHTGIDKNYYDKMLSSAPHLLATNVNHWFAANPDSRMLRTLDGDARALLSPRFRILDNMPIAEIVLDEIAKAEGELIPVSCEVTEKRLYMKFRYPSLSAQIKVGDIVEAGVVVWNSEIGFGRIGVAPYSFRLICQNGAKHDQYAHAKTHLGRAFEEFDHAYELFSDETRKTDDRAFFMKIRDVFRAALQPELFAQITDSMKAATTRAITGSVEGAVTILQKQNLLNEGERGSILQHLIHGGDLTQYGLSQAVTRTAEDLDSYDRATEFEELGARVLTMPESTWNVIANARIEDAMPTRRGRKPKNQTIDVKVA